MSTVIKTKGIFRKKFHKYIDGIEEVKELSFSLAQALGSAETEEEVVKQMATNVIYDRPTGNGVGWDSVSLSLSAHGAQYFTGGGLGFGWSVWSEDYQDYRERGESNSHNLWFFYIIHPKGENIPEDSSLRTSAAKFGWEEAFDQNGSDIQKPIDNLEI